MGLINGSDIFPPKIPTQFSVCCGMLQNPHQQAVFGCRGMLQPLVPGIGRRGRGRVESYWVSTYLIRIRVGEEKVHG